MAPRLLSYEPSYKNFLKKRKRKKAVGVKPPPPAQDMPPKLQVRDLTAPPPKRASKAKGISLGGPGQSARRSAPSGADPKGKRQREEPSQGVAEKKKKKADGPEGREHEARVTVEDIPSDGSSGSPTHPHAWAPKVVTESGRQVLATDSGANNVGVAAALCRSIILPRDKREFGDEGANAHFRQCHDLYQVRPHSI